LFEATGLQHLAPTRGVPHLGKYQATKPLKAKRATRGGPSAATATNAEEILQGNEEGSMELELPEDEEALRQELAEQKRIAERGAGHCPRNQ